MLYITYIKLIYIYIYIYIYTIYRYIDIDTYIYLSIYQVKLHSSSWFSAAWAAAIIHRNHLFRLYQTDKSSDFKVKFRQVGLLDQLHIFSQLYLIELVGLLTDLGLLEL